MNKAIRAEQGDRCAHKENGERLWTWRRPSRPPRLWGWNRLLKQTVLVTRRTLIRPSATFSQREKGEEKKDALPNENMLSVDDVESDQEVLPQAVVGLLGLGVVPIICRLFRAPHARRRFLQACILSHTTILAPRDSFGHAAAWSLLVGPPS